LKYNGYSQTNRSLDISNSYKETLRQVIPVTEDSGSISEISRECENKMNITERFASLSDVRASSQVIVLGIDLGTTNSTVAEAIWEPGQTPVCKVLEIDQPTREGLYTSPLVPSVVAILPDNQVWVGEGSKRLRAISQQANLFHEKNLFYDTKNEMGLRKTYFRAHERFDHPLKIAGHILEFLVNAARKITNITDHLSVTVPASFQLNQRRDTLLSCQYAGLNLKHDDLLDEPTSALIDYVLIEGNERVVNPGQATSCVVFDFGGGTCDVSVVEITGDRSSKRITISQRAVSRYHRLGGGDIDVAIIHECLIPKLLEENELKALDLTWAQKKKGLEPQLLGKAEALKISLCKEIDRLKKFGKYEEVDKSKLVAKQPPISCFIGNKEFRLNQPSLSAVEFDNVLEPFLDTELLYARETEFRLTQSICSPLQDALHRAQKEPHEIDFCLMVGGSSLIPQVRETVENYFSQGVVGYFKDHLAMQTAVSRGAAWNALFKALTKQPLIQPILHEGIALITTDGTLFPLIPSQTALPYPQDESYAKVKLVVPRGQLFVNELRLEIVGQAEKQPIFNEIWRLPKSASAGDEITLGYRVTAGKQFECRAYLTDFPESVLEESVENPLVNILNPHTVRLKIEKAEEELRQKGGGSAEDRDTFVQLARWYAEINQREKALDYLRLALNRLQEPDAEILNLQGIYFEELGDHDRAKKAYMEANRSTQTWSGPLFNLALSYKKRGLHKEALQAIEDGITKAGISGPDLTLKAMCMESLGDTEKAKQTLTEAMQNYDHPESLDDWELGWYCTAAKLLGDDESMKKAKTARDRRHSHAGDLGDDILRPAARGDLVVTER